MKAHTLSVALVGAWLLSFAAACDRKEPTTPAQISTFSADRKKADHRKKSKGEQTSKSHRVLGGKIAKARLGEWQGGPVRLGFDVACYHRETGTELWRVVFEGATSG